MAIGNGTSEDDRLRGTWGDAIFYGAAGSGIIDGRKGDDTAIFILSENIGATNVYHGWRGEDALRIHLTSDEFDEELCVRL